jgi:hypothetical protein
MLAGIVLLGAFKRSAPGAILPGFGYWPETAVSERNGPTFASLKSTLW